MNIDLKLKSYDELIFEITTLNTNNYLLQQKVEHLEKENKILKENAEHNDKVVDKVNWENMLLKKEKNTEIDRLNNIINGIEAYCNMAITMNFNMNNSKLQEQIVEDYTNVLDKLTELKENK